MSSPGRTTRHATTLLAWAGAIGLSASMLVGMASVLARHLGIALAGDIEIMRAAILLTASVALLSATLANRHASVHLLTERLPAAIRPALSGASTLLSLLFFLAVACGLAWIMSDLSHAHEQSAILRIPFAPLRWISLTAICGAAVACGLRNRRAGKR